MKQQAPELIKERDILGLEKPKNQLKHLRRKSDGWFLIVTLIALAIIALVVYYL